MSALINALPEQAVLGCLLQADLCIAKELLGVLRIDDFSDQQHRAVLEAIILCVMEEQPPDPVLILAKMREQGQALHDASTAGPFLVSLMQAAPSVGSASFYARSVMEDAFRRRVQEAGVRICQVAETAPLDVVLDVLRAEWIAIAEFKDRLPAVFA